LRRPICAIYPHRGLVPPKAAVFVDMVAAHLQRVLAPARSETPRRSIEAAYSTEAAPCGHKNVVGTPAPAIKS
jgi:hypothetical protein